MQGYNSPAGERDRHDQPRLLTLPRCGFSLAPFNAGQLGFSRTTFVVNGEPAVIQQVLRQLDRLVDIVE